MIIHGNPIRRSMFDVRCSMLSGREDNTNIQHSTFNIQRRTSNTNIEHRTSNIQHRTRKGRAGVTLTEVLVAIFIMGIGMISLLVLFPLGGMKMALAIKDERSAHSAANADAIARMFDLIDDPAVFPKYTSPGNALPQPPASGPSYPVYIDPLGVQLTGGSTPGSAGLMAVGAGSPGFARVWPQSIAATGPSSFRRWFTLLDDINFNEDGVPKLSGGVLERERRYTWAYLCRQVRATPPQAAPPYDAPDGIEVTVVVYDRRPEISTGGTLPTEHVHGVAAGQTRVFTNGSDQVFIGYTGTPPPIAKGSWVLDATVQPNINGYFYRVASVDDDGAGTLILSLTQPARANGTVCVVMENVVEVFEKGVRQ